MSQSTTSMQQPVSLLRKTTLASAVMSPGRVDSPFRRPFSAMSRGPFLPLAPGLPQASGPLPSDEVVHVHISPRPEHPEAETASVVGEPGTAAMEASVNTPLAEAAPLGHQRFPSQHSQQTQKTQLTQHTQRTQQTQQTQHSQKTQVTQHTQQTQQTQHSQAVRGLTPVSAALVVSRNASPVAFAEPEQAQPQPPASAAHSRQPSITSRRMVGSPSEASQHSRADTQWSEHGMEPQQPMPVPRAPVDHATMWGPQPLPYHMYRVADAQQAYAFVPSQSRGFYQPVSSPYFQQQAMMDPYTASLHPSPPTGRSFADVAVATDGSASHPLAVQQSITSTSRALDVQESTASPPPRLRGIEAPVNEKTVTIVRYHFIVPVTIVC